MATSGSCQDGHMAIIIKYGGNAMTDPQARHAVADAIADLALRGQAPVVVHGGGPRIAAALARAGLDSRFVRGLRVTTAESLPVVEAALTALNKELSQEIGNAVGLTGRDSHVLVASPLRDDLGCVGKMERVNEDLLDRLLRVGLTPVLACLAEDVEGRGMLNVNADSVAGAVAGALGAPVVFLTDVAGVLDDPKDAASLLPELPRAAALARIADGRISDGMIPKVEAALSALDAGAAFAVIADGRNADMLEDTLVGRAGTRITP